MNSAVDLFAGPGGLCLAAHAEGLSTIGIEYDPAACQTRRAAGLATIEADVRKHGPRDFPDATVLLGGPPCQPFSIAGNGEGRALLAHLQRRAKFMAARESLPDFPFDERSALVLEPLRWILASVDAGRPYRTVVLEQVDRVLPMWQTYEGILNAEGYSAVCGVLDAVRYGAPQTRRRAVLVASLDREVALPAPTHTAFRTRGLHTGAHLPWMNCVSMGAVLPHRGEFTVVSNYGTGGDPKNRGRRHSTEPAFTVTGKINRNRIVAPDGTELPRLTESEAGVLQGFPADYPWTGRDPWQQIGNVVPIPLGRAIIRAAIGAAA